jgi:hypothetical protein
MLQNCEREQINKTRQQRKRAAAAAVTFSFSSNYDASNLNNSFNLYLKNAMQKQQQQRLRKWEKNPLCVDIQ